MNLFGSLRNRLIAGLGLLLLLFLALVAAGIGSLRAVNRAVSNELTALVSNSALATALAGAVADEVRAGEAYLTAPSPALALEFLRLGDSSHAYRRRFRQVTGLSVDDQSVLNRVESNQARMELAYARAHALHDLGRLDEVRTEAAAARASADSFATDVRNLTRRQQARVSASITDIGERARQREVLVWLLLATAIVFGAGTALVTVRSIEAPLHQLITAARRFGEGDLRPLDLGTMPAELATLARTMGSMGTRLRSVIESVIRESRGIGMSASDLSAMSEELAAGSQEITRAITAISANAERQVAEVRSADQVIAAWRESAARDATTAERVVAEGEQANALAERHRDELTVAGRSLAALRQTVQAAGTQTRELTRRADAVGELLDLARQLVAQSEVLALNAAVEAARSAGQGDGFSAIAAETRRLADTSREAAARIATRIETLTEQIATLEATRQEIATQALKVESTTQRSTVALAEIARATETMRDNARHVAQSASESRGIAGRLADLRERLEADARANVTANESVTAGAAEQSAATGEIAIAAAGLLEASERLAALVAEFTV
jgi:methyl-accepting chemotaxis protein